MAITATGIGSGLDLNGLVTQLISAQSEPANRRLDVREADFQARISAYGSLKSSLSDFRSALSSITAPSSFSSRSTTSSDSDSVTATASNAASASTYAVEVSQLAQSQKLASDVFTDSSTIVGEGVLTFRFGTFDSGGNTFTADADRDIGTVTIDNTNSSLTGIRDAVNAAGIGITASIINDGAGSRLVFGSTSTGASSSIEVTVSGDSVGSDTDTDGLSKLAFDPTSSAGSGKNLSQTAAALDANFTIDGLTLSQSSNTLTDVVDGVTLNLLKVTTGPVSIDVSRNTDAATSAVQQFVGSFNQLAATFKSLSGFDADSQQGGVLLGDAVLRTIESNVRQIMTGVVDGLDAADVRSLSDIGVTTQADGTLALNTSRLNEAMDRNPDAVASLFGVNGLVTDSTVSFDGATDSTQPGRYAVQVSQLATNGQYVGAASSSLTVDALNNTLSVKVDGEFSSVVTLTQKTYASGAELAAEIQAQINADDALQAAGASVSVAFVSGAFEITSNSYGSDSSVSIVSAPSASSSTLGIGSTVGTSTTGADIAGSIGNVAADGSGQQLTGRGNATGLSLSVVGGSTGLRGTVTFSRGFASELLTAVDGYLAKDAGLESSIEGLEARTETLNEERVALAERLAKEEERIRAEFATLDALVAQFNTTSNFLAAQLAALPTVGKKSD